MTTRLAVCIVLTVLALACDRESPSDARDLATYRSTHPVKITNHDGPPMEWRDPTPLRRPRGVNEVTYDSNGLKLKAWISRIPDDGKLRPAVVFCHGGFWFGNEDWDLAEAFVNAGFVLMMPRVRAENGNPGEFEFYYHEADDIVNAGRYLAAQPGIDRSRVFVSGHSAGGTLSLLAVMMDGPYAMAAPISPTLDVRPLVQVREPRYANLVVFDRSDSSQVVSRSAMFFASSLRTPVALFRGDQEDYAAEYKQFTDLAAGFNKTVTETIVPGDHGDALRNGVSPIIQLFKQFRPPPG